MNDRFLLFLLIGLNLVLKLVWHGADVLVHDEPFTVYWSQRPWPEFWGMLRGENNPPLHFLLTRAWSAMVPFEPAWLRLPSALFSALTVWPLFLIARSLKDSRTALVSGLVFTFSNYHFGFAHEVRPYALLTLLSVISMWLIVRSAISPDASRDQGRWMAAALIAMVYTHFFGWLMIGALGCCALLVPVLRPARKPLLRSTLIAAAAFAPYALFILARARETIAEGTWLSPPTWEEPYNMIWRWSNAPVIAVCFLIIIAWAVIRSRSTSALIRLGALWSLLPLTGMFLVSFWIPVFHDRYLVFAAPGFAILVSASISAVPTPPKGSAFLSGAAVAAMAITCTPWSKGRYEPSRTVELVNQWCHGDCHVEVVPSWYWLNYLAAKDIAQLRVDQRPLLESTLLVPDRTQAKGLGTYILIDASGSDEFAGLRARLRESYPMADSVEADHRVWVQAYRASR